MPRKKEPTFEENLDRLRELVDLLESGAMPLKETFTAYEEGRKIAVELEKMLLEGEKRIMMMDRDGSAADITDEIAEAKEG